MYKHDHKLCILDFFLDIYFEYLFISLIAFLPSLRVLIASQPRNKVINAVSVVREIKNKSI